MLHPFSSEGQPALSVELFLELEQGIWLLIFLEQFPAAAIREFSEFDRLPKDLISQAQHAAVGEAHFDQIHDVLEGDLRLNAETA